jgi:dihydropyrimidinase
VIPGAIDPHTHIELPFGGTTTCDDFTSGTVSAAFGGTTSLVDFCFQMPGQTFAEALETWHEKIDRCKPVIDVGFHMAITDLKEGGSLEDLAKVPDEGVTSYKLFMAYKGAVMVDDETLFKSMQVAADTGALVMVHAENGDAIDLIVKRAVEEGKTEPVWHARTRPMETEAEATNRAVQLARIAGCPLYVVHVSCEPAVEPIRLAREKGWNTWGETCTQYLFIDESHLDQPGFEGAKYVYTPPPRPKEHQEHLWRALQSGVLSVVSTDHCPFKWPEQKGINGQEFQKIPNGGPGIENRLHMLYHFGVRTGRLSMNKLVELTSTNVARLFGLYPRKGTIAPGADADIVVWDPEKALTISAQTHHSNVNYNLFEGTEVHGAPEVVLVRGQVIVENDELVGQPGAGRFIRRARFGEELAPTEEAVPA